MTKYDNCYMFVNWILIDLTMIEWRTARFLMIYLFLIGGLLVVIVSVRYFQGQPSLFTAFNSTISSFSPTITPTTRSAVVKSAPRPDINPVLTIPENPPSIFANDETYVGHESNSEGEDYSF